MRGLCGELRPFRKRSGAVLPEVVAVGKFAVEVEMIMDRGVRRSKVLQRLMSRNRAIAPSRRLNGWCEFSALLLRYRPHSWRSETPITFIAARYDRSLSVTMDHGDP